MGTEDGGVEDKWTQIMKEQRINGHSTWRSGGSMGMECRGSMGTEHGV